MLTFYPFYIIIIDNLMIFKGKSKLDLKLIDNHIHGSFGINFNYGTYSEIKCVLSELFKKNIKGICPTLVGDKSKNIQKQLAIFKKIKDEQLKNALDEALILGIHLEGSFLSPDKSGIQDKNVFLKPSIENFKNLTGDFEDIIKIVTIAPEEDIDLINYLNENNIITQAGHTKGNDLKNTKGVTHLFNAMNPIHHRELSIALSALINDEIYVEIIPDLIHTNKEILSLVLKAKPKNKILLISDSLPSSNFDKDIIFCNKKIDKYGKDSTGTLAGSNKTLDEICKKLIENKILSKEDIKLMAFENQIKYLDIRAREIDILNR